MVVTIEKKPTLKIAILATLTLLTLTTASAHEWVSPSDGNLYDSPLNLTLDPQGNPQSVDFEINYPGKSPRNKTYDTVSDGEFSFPLTDSAPSGDYSVQAYVHYSSKTNTSRSISFTLDNSKPSITSTNIEDGERVNSSTLSDFEVGVNDDYSAISSVNVSLMNQGGSLIDSSEETDCDSSCSFSLSSDSLDQDAGYELQISVQDEAGNTRELPVDFTYDNEYQGDEDPEITPQPQVFATPKSKDKYTFGIDLEQQDPQEPSEISVTCEMGDQSVSAGTKDVGENGATYSCDIEPMWNTQTALEVFMTDAAGNSVSKEFEYTFDYSKPVVENVSTVVSVFNSDFEVNYDYSDSASEVTDLIYQVDDSSLDTDNEKLSVNGSFTVDTSGLDSGSHTLYVWVRDEAGRWSESASLEFEFRPEADPKASVSGLETVYVTAGSSKTFEFSVRNTGELLIPSLTFNLETGFSNHTSIVSGLMPGENSSVSFTVDTSESDLGRHSVSLNASNPDISKSFDLVVEANSDQRENISSMFERKYSRFKELRSNVSELMAKVSGERQEKLENKFSDLNKTMNKAEEAIDKGRYYRAESLLEGVDSEFSQASQGFEQVRTEYKTAQRNKLIFGFLLVLVLGGGGAVGYFYWNDEYVFDLSALEGLELDGVGLGDYEFSTEPVEGYIERVKGFFKEEEEKAEEAFQGFT